MLDKLSSFALEFISGPEKALFRKIKKTKAGIVNIYGCGLFGREIIELIDRDNSLGINRLFDKQAEYLTYDINNIKVEPPEAMSELEGDDVLIIASKAYTQEMIELVRKIITNKNIKILTL